MTLRTPSRTLAAAYLAAAACIGAGALVAGAALWPHRAAASRAHDSVLRVTEKDFKITSSASVVRAGEVDITVHNRGPDAHELIVVRQDGSSPLPLRSDGLTVNEEQLEPRIPGLLEPATTGATRQLRVRLRPGRYVLMCNMSGHYMGGMKLPLVVR